MTPTKGQTVTGRVRCPGCGESFRGERGLRAHQSRRFVTIACRPIRQEK